MSHWVCWKLKMGSDLPSCSPWSASSYIPIVNSWLSRLLFSTSQLKKCVPDLSSANSEFQILGPRSNLLLHNFREQWFRSKNSLWSQNDKRHQDFQQKEKKKFNTRFRKKPTNPQFQGLRIKLGVLELSKKGR